MHPDRDERDYSNKGVTMKLKTIGFGLALILALAATASAADLRATGRELAGKIGGAVIRVNVVIKMTAQMEQRQEREIAHEVNGTVIGEDGLTLVPLSDIDPASMLRQMRDIKLETTVKDIKLLMADGKEIPATVVSRDADLDVAFLRPVTKPATKFTFVNLADSAQPQLLEQVVVVARLGKIANRRISVMTGEIQAIVEKPRTFYVPSSELATGGEGVPIYNADGKVIGIVLTRMLAGRGDEDPMVIIMPASDLDEIARQVPEKAAEEPAAVKPAPAPTATPAPKTAQ